MSVERKGQLSCNACISIPSVIFHHKSGEDGEARLELWTSSEGCGEQQIMVTSLSCDWLPALTVSVSQSPGGEPLCCKIYEPVVIVVI